MMRPRGAANWAGAVHVGTLALALFVGSPAHAMDVAVLDGDAVTQGWEPVRDEEGVKVYIKKFEGSSIYGLRSDGVVDAPLDRVASVFLDHARAPEWIDRIQEERVVRFTGPSDYVEYNRFELPFPLSNRDYVTQVHVAADATRKALTMTSKSIDAPDLPSPCVRGSLETAYLLSAVEDGKRTRIQVLYLMDPHGAIPHWVVNLFQKSWPIKTFQGIRRQLKRSDIREPPLPQLRELVGELRKFTAAN